MEFYFQLGRKPETVLNKVCALAQDKVMVTGDDRHGRFTGLYEGTYTVEDNMAAVVVTQKPVFTSWSVVNEGLKYLVA
jgi:hypothetical protein